MSSIARLREIESLSLSMNKSFNTKKYHSLEGRQRRLLSVQQFSKRNDGDSIKKPSQRYATLTPEKDREHSNFQRMSSKVKQQQSKDIFCGQVLGRSPYQSVLRKIVDKYKKNTRPSNASQNKYHHTGHRQSKSQKLEMCETVRDEVRRMSVLSKVIAENNRKEIFLQRHKSIKRQLYMF